MVVKIFRMLAVLVCMAGLISCISVGGSGYALPERYYLLTAKASIVEPRTELSLGVGPIRVAPFLDRSNIVIHNAGGEMTLPDNHRWAETLEHGIQRVMLQNTDALSGAKVRSFPWSRATAPDLALRLDVLDLNRRPDGIAVLEVNWVLEDLRSGTLIQARRDGFMANSVVEENDYFSLVNAYSELFTQLAQRVTEYLPLQ